MFILAISLFVGCTPADKSKWDQMFGGNPAGVGRVEEWTIECNAYTGPEHDLTAQRMATLLKKVPELDPKSVRVEQRSDTSSVLYGTYELVYVQAQVDDAQHSKGDVIPEFTDQINRDHEFIRGLSLNGQFPFFSARKIPKPVPDEGPPEWDLRNVEGAYTLHVGVTYPTPTLHNYKEAAVEWVRDLRNRGYDAYYYHDPEKAQSDICVGVFGESAVSVHKITDPHGDIEVKTEYSPEVTALQSKEELCWNLENGTKVFRSARNPQTGEAARMPNKSFLVRIPGRDRALQH